MWGAGVSGCLGLTGVETVTVEKSDILGTSGCSGPGSWVFVFVGRVCQWVSSFVSASVAGVGVR